MSYDFHIAYPGYVSKEVARFGGLNHQELLQRTQVLKLPLFARFADYYESGVVSVSEIDAFEGEVDQLLLQEYIHPGTLKNIQALKDLCAQAKREGRPIESSPD